MCHIVWRPKLRVRDWGLGVGVMAIRAKFFNLKKSWGERLMEAEQIWLWEKYLWGTGEYRIFWSHCIHTLEQHGLTTSQEQGPVKAHEDVQFFWNLNILIPYPLIYTPNMWSFFFFLDILMLRISIFKILKYSYHENILPWKNILPKTLLI
jgi:hypothetical protein